MHVIFFFQNMAVFEKARVLGGVGIDMYTAPAYFGILLNIGCFLSVFFVFRESTVGIKAKVQTENGKNFGII